MTVSAASLSQCYTCHQRFELPETVQQESLMMTVCCFKIIHQSCLKNAINKQQPGKTTQLQTCIWCRQSLDPSKSGKPIEAIWKVFQIATKHFPEDVSTVFNGKKLDKSTDTTRFVPDIECAICYNDNPDINISYLPDVHQFSHSQCIPTSTPSENISLAHLAWLSKQLVSKHPDLAKQFSPQRS